MEKDRVDWGADGRPERPGTARGRQAGEKGPGLSRGSVGQSPFGYERKSIPVAGYCCELPLGMAPKVEGADAVSTNLTRLAWEFRVPKIHHRNYSLQGNMP